MMLRVDNVHFCYQVGEVLKGISFCADSGDLLCVLGPNGSGKTTLFKCILGFFNPCEGKVSISGKEIGLIPRGQLAKLIAYIPQAHTPCFNYSVLDVVLMGRACYVGRVGSPQKSDYDEAQKALGKMRILHLKDKGYSEISGGERQLVLVARAIAQQSKILVMDEPTSNLDYGNQVTVLKEIRRLCGEGYLIIMSSHNPDHAFFYANKVLLIKDGQVLSEGDPYEVVDAAALESLYSVKMELVEINKGDNEKRSKRVCVPVL